ncbi:MAG: MinD/ParA family protein [Clostridia bacterium]|nr:MinD/ParA family protein [Clostridia bacterium]
MQPLTGIYKGQVLKGEIINAFSKTFKIKIPYHRNKIVLLPSGTMVRVEIPERMSFLSEIVSKTFLKGQSCFELTIPYQLTKAGKKHAPHIITVTSGKGGVGKSTLLINVAMALSKQGMRVCIVDADMGTANIDVLLNLNARASLQDLLRGNKNIFQIIMEGPCGSTVVPGTSGFQAPDCVTEAEVQKIINSLGLLERYVDIILVDTSPGVLNNSMLFNQFADFIIVLATPEPHAITDAYAALKIFKDKKIQSKLGLVVNRVFSRSEAYDVSHRIIKAAQKFLSLDINDLGFVMEDPNVLKSVRRLWPCVLQYPHSPASQCYEKIAGNLKGLLKWKMPSLIVK